MVKTLQQRSDRLELLALLSSETFDLHRSLARDLVDGDAKVFQAILERADLCDHHLEPLVDLSAPIYAALAIKARQHGHRVHEIALQAVSGSKSWAVSAGHEYWTRWAAEFASDTAKAPEEFSPIRDQVIEVAAKLADEQASDHRQLAMHGLSRIQ